MIHSSLISLKDLVLSETSYLATSSAQIHAELTYDLLPFKKLNTSIYAVFSVPTYYLNTSHQHPLAAEGANSIWSRISRSPGKRSGRH